MPSIPGFAFAVSFWNSFWLSCAVGAARIKLHDFFVEQRGVRDISRVPDLCPPLLHDCHASGSVKSAHARCARARGAVTYVSSRATGLRCRNSRDISKHCFYRKLCNFILRWRDAVSLLVGHRTCDSQIACSGIRVLIGHHRIVSMPMSMSIRIFIVSRKSYCHFRVNESLWNYKTEL